ncbi:MAG: CinA family protein [Treponema sp.]|nr:CinA family protein [Treponema sp.]
MTIKAEVAAEAVIHRLKQLSFTLALSESCTAGLVSSLLARIPGASDVLWGSFVCYTKEAKLSMLELDNLKISAYGLVSRETVSSMAVNTLKKSGAKIAAAVTGLAGPDGDGSNVPVGTVWIATAKPDEDAAVEKKFGFKGARNEVRLKAAISVFETILERLADCTNPAI